MTSDRLTIEELDDFLRGRLLEGIDFEAEVSSQFLLRLIAAARQHLISTCPTCGGVKGCDVGEECTCRAELPAPAPASAKCTCDDVLSPNWHPGWKCPVHDAPPAQSVPVEESSLRGLNIMPTPTSDKPSQS